MITPHIIFIPILVDPSGTPRILSAEEYPCWKSLITPYRVIPIPRITPIPVEEVTAAEACLAIFLAALAKYSGVVHFLSNLAPNALIFSALPLPGTIEEILLITPVIPSFNLATNDPLTPSSAALVVSNAASLIFLTSFLASLRSVPFLTIDTISLDVSATSVASETISIALDIVPPSGTILDTRLDPPTPAAKPAATLPSPLALRPIDPAILLTLPNLPFFLLPVVFPVSFASLVALSLVVSLPFSVSLEPSFPASLVSLSLVVSLPFSVSLESSLLDSLSLSVSLSFTFSATSSTVEVAVSVSVSVDWLVNVARIFLVFSSILERIVLVSPVAPSPSAGVSVFSSSGASIPNNLPNLLLANFLPNLVLPINFLPAASPPSRAREVPIPVKVLPRDI